MGRMYIAQFEDIAVTAAQDLFELLAPSTAVVILHDFLLSQRTEVGDAAEEMLTVKLVRGTGTITSGSGGASVTPAPVNKGDAAFGGSVERNNTTNIAVGSPGSLTTVGGPWAWNIRVPFEKVWTPESRPVISPGDYLTLELVTPPADSITMSGSITIEEIGG